MPTHNRCLEHQSLGFYLTFSSLSLAVQVSLVTGSHVKYIGPVSQDKDQDYSVVPTQLAHLELIEQRLNSPEDLEACVTGRVVSVARYKARLLDAFQQWFRKLKTLIPDKSVASTITRVDQLCDVLGNVQLQPEIVSRWKKRTGNGRGESISLWLLQ